METGPRASHTFDLALTELDAAFIVEIGTEIGATILAKIESRRADSRDAQTAEQLVGEAADKMGRKLDTEGLPELMLDRLDDPVWDRVAERCLSCTNCTMVCPTCFCSTVVEVNDLTDETSIRERVWDSCYSMDFAYIHKGTRRPTVKDRYRQWLTHKLATWRDQFETSGCVGCGRCITWCPPGIDLTEEAAALRASAERDRKA
jgi:ferredoxin